MENQISSTLFFDTRRRSVVISLLTAFLLLSVVFIRPLVTGSSVASAHTLAQSTVTEYPLPEGAGSLVAGPDGNIWLSSGNTIETWSTDGTRLATYQIPTPNVLSSSVIVGPDQNIWYIGWKGHDAGTISNGVITEYSLPGDEGTGLVAGSDDFLWFTSYVFQTHSYILGKISLSGEVTTIMSDPVSIGGLVAGADGSLWFMETDAHGAKSINHMALDGTLLATYAIPGTSNANALIFGSDGNLWFVDTVKNSIFDPAKSSIAMFSTTTGLVTEYPLPVGVQPSGLVLGPDGGIWFDMNTITISGPTGNTLGRISPSGDISTVTVPGTPLALAAGPDGNLWFDDLTNQALGVLTLGS
jgi:sugar lactone lactonase YvrE